MPFSWWDIRIKIKKRVCNSAACGFGSWSCIRTLMRREQPCSGFEQLLLKGLREGDGRLAGKYMEEVRTRAVLENLSDIASMRVPRCSNADQQQAASPPPLPCLQSCLPQKRLSKGREVYSVTQWHNGTSHRFNANRPKGWGLRVLHLGPPKTLIQLMVHRTGYKHLHWAF